MFRFRFKRKLNADAFTNLIAEGSVVSGTVRFTGIQKIQGTVNGDVLSGVEDKSNDVVIIDETGEVTSDLVRANDAIIAGQLRCKELWVEDTLRILSTAQIKGATIFFRTLEIEPGALITDCKLLHLDHTSRGEQV